MSETNRENEIVQEDEIVHDPGARFEDAFLMATGCSIGGGGGWSDVGADDWSILFAWLIDETEELAGSDSDDERVQRLHARLKHLKETFDEWGRGQPPCPWKQGEEVRS